MNVNQIPPPPNFEDITPGQKTSPGWQQWFFLLQRAVSSAITAGSAQLAIQFKSNGVNQGTSGQETIVDFVGDGVSALDASGTLTVTVSQMSFNKLKAYAARH
jgi:hypothetical protein